MKTDLFWKWGTAFVVTEKGTVGITFFKISRSASSRKLTRSMSPYVFKLAIKNFSDRKTIIECIVKRGGWSEITNLDWFFIWSAVCVEETDFE